MSMPSRFLKYILYVKKKTVLLWQVIPTPFMYKVLRRYYSMNRIYTHVCENANQYFVEDLLAILFPIYKHFKVATFTKHQRFVLIWYTCEEDSICEAFKENIFFYIWRAHNSWAYCYIWEPSSVFWWFLSRLHRFSLVQSVF